MDHFEIRHPDFHSVIGEDAQLDVVADGFTFTEGPIWHPDDHYLIFSDVAESCQYRWSETDGLAVFRKPSNQANGNCFDPDGRVVSCEHASSELVRHEHGGKLVSAIARQFERHELNSPNDVVSDGAGNIYFTDPAFGRTREDLGILRDQELPFQGVYRLSPQGELSLLVKDLQQPNGLCLSLDETQLYVNDSWGPTIHRYQLTKDGTVEGGTLWATVTGDGAWVPDGMKLDLNGHLFCNGPGGVHIFNSDAECLGVILLPEKSTNFCFGSADRTQLFITASTRVYRIETKTKGPEMIPGRA